MSIFRTKPTSDALVITIIMVHVYLYRINVSTSNAYFGGANAQMSTVSTAVNRHFFPIS